MENDINVKFIPGATWTDRSKWELLQPYTSANDEVTVSAGFITDGASIPLLARGFFSPTGRYFGAAIVHDYIIVAERDWVKANEQFEAELDSLQISPTRKFILMSAVVSWSKFLKLLGLNSIDDWK